MSWYLQEHNVLLTRRQHKKIRINFKPVYWGSQQNLIIDEGKVGREWGLYKDDTCIP